MRPLRRVGSPGHLLVVEDDEAARDTLARLLRLLGHSVVEAASSEEALARTAEIVPDLILLDLELPGGGGLALLERIREDHRLRGVPVLILSGSAPAVLRLHAVRAGATDFLSPPITEPELGARVRTLLEWRAATEAIEDAEQALFLLARMIDARDRYTNGHSARVSLYATLLAERVGMAAEELAAVQRGSLLHDVGKIGVRDHVLFKPGKLGPDELAEVREHPARGRDLLSKVRSLGAAVEVVLHHHERMDGSGYPGGLRGDEIPLTARVTTIADVFDALKTARIYRGTLSRTEALDVMTAEVRKGWWDGRLLDVFRGALEELREDDPRLTALAFPSASPRGA